MARGGETKLSRLQRQIYGNMERIFRSYFTAVVKRTLERALTVQCGGGGETCRKITTAMPREFPP
jgi:hypothetical protein